MAQITYEDKVALYENEEIADINKCNASDMNEIKEVVNDIEEKTLVEYITKSGENLDNYTTQGIYFFNSSFTPINIPAGVNGWLVVLTMGETDNTDKFVKQIWYRAGTPNANDFLMFVRTRSWDGTTWSSWRKIQTVDNVDWQLIDCSSYFQGYGGAAGNRPRVKKIGDAVYLHGIVNPTSEIAANSTTLICTLPEKYRPSVETIFVCQGSGQNRWTLIVRTNGDVVVERYGAATNIAIPTTAWMPFDVSFISRYNY